MVTLSTPRDFRSVQRLPFCYVCGQTFVPGDATDRDHVPAKKIFRIEDRTPPLWLTTHRRCNGGHSQVDQKLRHLIGLRRREVPNPRDRQLVVKVYGPGQAALMNLNLDAAIMRWVRAFHAALYREPLPDQLPHALVTPFPVAKQQPVVAIHRIPPHHIALVHTIKEQRALRNVDSINSNNGKLTYECVWDQSDDGMKWLCVFALNLYDWKILGKTLGQPLRGCAGIYTATPPANATRKRRTTIIIPNVDKLDPFAA